MDRNDLKIALIEFAPDPKNLWLCRSVQVGFSFTLHTITQLNG